MHTNSLEAYATTPRERAGLEHRIVGLMHDGKARTDREIAYELGHPEPLRPRITNLIEQGILHEVGSKLCPVTHKTVRLTKRFLAIVGLLLLSFNASASNIPDTQAIRALYGESCGEPYRAKLLVAATIRARGSLKGIYGGSNRQLSHIDARTWNECVRAWNESASVKSPYRYFGGMIDDKWFKAHGMTPALTVGKTRFYF
jgi:hypothetical protein